jgi:hypothetical protein
MLLYKAERLLEKGQHKLSLKYFKRVLQAKPDCKEAVEAGLLTAELLDEDELKNTSLKTIDEKAATTMCTTIEMEVHWTDSESALYDYCHDYYPKPERAAFDAWTSWRRHDIRTRP